MQVLISGQHITVGTALQEYVKNRVTNSINKYFDHPSRATIHFIKEKHESLCDIIINDGTGRHTVIKSNAGAEDFYSAFDIALSKVEKQLRKYKSKLKDHSHRMKLSEIATDSVKYIISKPIENNSNESEEIDIDNHNIIAEKQVKILKLSVGQAVMKMDLEDIPALMFINSESGRTNVVYYRKDGNISWVDAN